MIDQEIIGMEVDEAIETIEGAGLKARIAMEDGQPFMLTMDYRMDRINLDIQNGKVIGTHRG